MNIVRARSKSSSESKNLSSQATHILLSLLIKSHTCRW